MNKLVFGSKRFNCPVASATPSYLVGASRWAGLSISSSFFTGAKLSFLGTGDAFLARGEVAPGDAAVLDLDGVGLLIRQRIKGVRVSD